MEVRLALATRLRTINGGESPKDIDAYSLAKVGQATTLTCNCGYKVSRSPGISVPESNEVSGMRLALVAVCVSAILSAPMLPCSVLGAAAPAISAPLSSGDDVVVFNTKTFKYHIPSCMWAKRCTCNCIKISRKEACSRGGVPCKVCGAGEG